LRSRPSRNLFEENRLTGFDEALIDGRLQ
jgi:hypothetical protein